MAQEIRDIINPYRYVDGQKIKEKSALQFEKNLNDDYIKFLRFAEIQIESQVGIIGYITNNGFLESATLRGLRNHLINIFNKRWFIDLHGDTDKREVDESGKPDKNVFDIKKGVTISLLLRNKIINKNDNIVYRFDIKGEALSKNDWLTSHSLKSTNFVKFSTKSPNYYFFYIDEAIDAEYASGIPIQQIYGINSTGFESGRDEILTDFSSKELKVKLKEFRIIII